MFYRDVHNQVAMPPAAVARPAFTGGQLLRDDPAHFVPDRRVQARAWYRYWARWLDWWIFGFALCIAWPHLFGVPHWGWHLLYLPPAYILIETAFLSAFGATPGKMLLGIRVLTSNGHRLTFSQALVRSVDVYVRGMALGIPIACLWAYWVAWGVLEADGATSWDARNDYVVRQPYVGPLRWVVVLAVPFALAIGLYVAQSKHPEWFPELTRLLEAERGKVERKAEARRAEWERERQRLQRPQRPAPLRPGPTIHEP